MARRRSQWIDTRNPVDWSHPYNTGRLAWWLTLPSWKGGYTWRDVARKGNDGTLTNFGTLAPGVSGWQGAARPGGYGHLLFDGSDDYVSITASLFTTSRPFVVAAWVRTDTSSGIRNIFCAGNGSAYATQLRQESGNWVAYSNSAGSDIGITDSGGVTVGRPTRLAHVWDGSTQRIFRDGVQVASGSLASLDPGRIGTSNRIGSEVSGVQFFQGAIDDVGLWAANPLATSDPARFAALDYELSRRAYPGVLRRLRRSVVAGLGGSTASGAGTATGTSSASGVGAASSASAGSASGSAVAAGIALALAAAIGSATGTGTVTGVGGALAPAVGTASGASTASGAGASSAVAVGTASGVASASGIGSSTVAAVGTASGTGAATGTGSALDAAVGTASGTGTSSGVGASTASATGTAAGSASATGVGASSSEGSATGTATGSGTATGVGSALDAAVGSAAGSATASAVGSATAVSTGTAAGTATASGVGSSTTAGSSVGSASGTSSATGVGASSASSAGTATGAAAASGVGASDTSGAATGTASGTSAASGVGRSTANAAGTATGTATAAGRSIDVTLPASLAAAVVTAWAAAGLNATVGKLYRSRPPAAVKPPHAIFWITQGSAAFRSDTTTLYNSRLKIRVRDVTGDGAGEKALLVADAFLDMTFEWQTGYATKLLEERQSDDIEKDFTTGSVPAYMQELEWSMRTKGDR